MQLKPRNKSGQAAIVIVVVTMMTILGVAVATSSQSRVNLRDTVYSTQAEQAIGCAESGVEVALVDPELQGETELSSGGKTVSSDEDPSKSILGGCDRYTTVIYNYPEDVPNGNGEVVIPNLTENDVQQLNISAYSSGDEIEIRFRAVENDTNSALGVYQYHSDNQVERVFLYCGNDGEPDDFVQLSPGAEGICTYEIDVLGSGSRYLRFRSLLTSNSISIPNFEGNTGYFIDSRGVSGPVERVINVYRFYSQMPASFDEAVVSYGSDPIVDL